MRSIIRDNGLESFGDIHIDKIERGWAPAGQWLVAGLEAYGLAMALRERCQFEVTVALAFTLRPRESPSGVDFKTAEGLKERFGWTPPSLHLFPKGKEPWGTEALRFSDGDGYPKVTVSILDVTQLFGSEVPGVAYLIEFLQSASDDWKRTLFVAA
jgi:hypothetical protein